MAKVSLENLPSNNRTTENKPKKIIEGDYVEGPKSGKLASELRNAGNGIFERLVVPGLQSLFMEVVEDGLSQTLEGISEMIFGRSAKSFSKRGRNRAYNQMYSSMSESRYIKPGASPNHYVRQEALFQDLFLPNRNDARRVLEYLRHNIQKQGYATVGDYYHMVGKSATITHEKWGWLDLNNTRINWSSEGYIIDFPEPVHLN